MKNRLLALLSLLLIGPSIPAIAAHEVRVNFTHTNMAPTSQTFDGAPAVINIPTSNTIQTISIRDNTSVPGVADVGPVVIQGNHFGNIDVSVSNVHDLEGLVTSDDADGIRVTGITISGDLTGPVKSSSVGVVFLTGGDIKSGAHIEATIGRLQQVFVLGATGTIEAGVNLIGQSEGTSIRVDNGDFLGNILLAEVGSQGGARLNQLQVFNGRVGTSTTTRSIIRAKSTGNIDVATDVFADIIIGGGQISSLDSMLKVDSITVGGDISGSVIGNTIDAMAIGGDLDADVEVFTVANGVVAATDWRVGDSFTTGNTITITDDLAGQITFNNNNAGGAWSGGVTVGGVTLSPTGYTETADSLGDGASGIVPFGLHGVSCDPVDDGNMGLPSSDPFYIRHYGPVGKSTKGIPVTVMRKVAGSAATATDHTAGFSYLIDGMGNHLLKASLAPGYVYLSGYEYTVEPVTTGADRLFCEDAVGTPGVDGYDYTFTVGTCPADINGDGTIDTADLGILINNFGQSALSIPGDLNNDTDVDTADLGILISLFGETCGIPAAAMAGGGGGLSASALLQELGFSSVEGYTAWLDTLTERQCVEHVCSLMEMIEEH